MKKRNKSAQAFIISAVIIIMILIAFITIENYSKKTTLSEFPYIAKKIQIESEQVMDYALISQDNLVIDQFTEDIDNYLDEYTRIYFITGGPDPNSIKFYNYIDNQQNLLNDIVINNNIQIKIDDTPYEFPLTKGKHFYFVMIKEYKGEKYVYKNA